MVPPLRLPFGFLCRLFDQRLEFRFAFGFLDYYSAFRTIIRLFGLLFGFSSGSFGSSQVQDFGRIKMTSLCGSVSTFLQMQLIAVVVLPLSCAQVFSFTTFHLTVN